MSNRIVLLGRTCQPGPSYSQAGRDRVQAWVAYPAHRLDNPANRAPWERDCEWERTRRSPTATEPAFSVD